MGQRILGPMLLAQFQREMGRDRLCSYYSTSKYMYFLGRDMFTRKVICSAEKVKQKNCQDTSMLVGNFLTTFSKWPGHCVQVHSPLPPPHLGM